MVLTTPMVFAQTDGLVLLLLDHTRTRGPSVAHMHDFYHATSPKKKEKKQSFQNCIGPTIRIGGEILRLPYAGFFFFFLSSKW